MLGSSALGCAAEGPPITECRYGRYHAECGGSGDRVAGCDLETGECRWFLGGVVAAGYVASSCPADGVCCVPVPGGGGWPFSGWAPSGPILDRAKRDLGVLTTFALTSDSPEGVLVTFDEALADYVAPGPLAFEMECGEPGLCGYQRSELAVTGESLVLSLYRTNEPAGLVLEVRPDSGGVLRARVIGHGLGLPFEYDETAVRCAFRAFAYDMVGTMRLAPGSLEDAAVAHGELSVDIGSTPTPFVIRF